MASVRAEFSGGPAGAAMTAEDNYKFVKLNASGQVVLCSDAADIPIGVVTNAGDVMAEGDAVSYYAISASSRIKVLAGSAIAGDSDIGTNANGEAVVKTSGHSVGFSVGAAVDEEIFEVVVAEHVAA